MIRFEAIKNFNIDEFTQWLRATCLYSHFHGVALDTDSIKKWLEEDIVDGISF